MKYFSTLTAASLATALNTIPAGAVTVDHSEAVQAGLMSSEYSVEVTKEASVEGERKRYQEILATPTGSTDVSFLVEQQDDGSYLSSCVASRQAGTKAYSLRDTGESVEARSQVSYQFAQQFQDGSTREVSMMGAPIDEAQTITLGDTALSASVADLQIDKASNYMIVPDDKGIMLPLMLQGVPGADTAYSPEREEIHAKLIEATYREGAQDVSETFSDCLQNKLNNLEAVENAIAKATRDFDFDYEVVTDAPEGMKADLIASARDEFADILANVDPADVDVVQITEVTGGVLATLDGWKVTNPANNHTIVNAGCYGYKEFDANGDLYKIGASHTVVGSQEKSACLGSSESTTTSTTTVEEVYVGEPFNMTSDSSSMGNDRYTTNNETNIFDRNWGSTDLDFGDTIKNENNLKVICGNIVSGDNFGTISDSFNNCNDKPGTDNPTETPSQVFLDKSRDYLIGVLLFLSCLGAYASRGRSQAATSTVKLKPAHPF